ncbi:MAG: lactonase family protein [Flavisolibacter sp.]
MRLVILGFFCCCSLVVHAQKSFLFIGGYNDKLPGKGIYVYSFDASTGKANLVSNTEGVVNPSYFILEPSGNYLYACTESRITGGGSVTAFKFDKRSGQLSLINKQPSGGDNPVYISLHKNGKWLAVANYTAGNLSVFPVASDGSIRPFAQNIQHTGNSIRANQDRPHVHSAVFSPEGDFLFVSDLGIDRIMIYRFNKNEDKPLQKSGYQIAFPGSGPRHFIFHPNRKYAYLIEEMGGAVVGYKYNAKGRLDSLQRIITHDGDSTGAFHSADIHISPDGKFLYASNRMRQNNIAIFSIDQKTGRLKLLGYQDAGGIGPRNFAIDPSGKYLLVANQVSNNIVIFRRNIKTGMLTATGEEIKAPEPTCLKMLAASY